MDNDIDENEWYLYSEVIRKIVKKWQKWVFDW